jgi:hypothetical protein
VLVFGVGAYLHFSGPRRSLGWLILVLVAAYAGQQSAAGSCPTTSPASSAASF